MKLSIFIVFLIGMAGCTSPQAPVVKQTAIAGLSIPDTVDFGIVGNGLTVDSNVIFQNNGMDTIHITSQGFNDPSFKLVESKWTSFNIGPGTAQHIGIQFTVTDTNQVFGFDTVRSSNASNIMVLHGKGNTFSSLFPSAPTSVTVTLTGLIGVDLGGTTHDFDFSFGTYNAPEQWADTLNFYSTYSSCSNDGAQCDAGTIEIWFHIDTTQKRIDWLKASSYDQVMNCTLVAPGVCGDGTTSYTTTTQDIALNDLSLSRDSNGWSGSATGLSLNSIVDSAQYLKNISEECCNQTLSQLTKINGYESNATLTVSIH
jgi:hypothetical protein